ncbi:2-oxo acid dehydrogenase subunit E2 [Halorubrum sp. SD626R]|uniref:2-oxo acid dehydrogenase subunit E2 n=1 Tax=Halorubrum sp. SD626R TaxID=1419722 RepID=UPI0010F9567A|nr:2-oxo acid dehydrogenase subunit E2 [Halorubrum sp. SD626R]TKX79051.1 2-oxo acid dehydrogenase subunit E2 [Halorubrum sp. SD626R]
MSVKEFTLPDVGEGVAEGELVTWLVSPGDRVEEDQPVAEVETDKALVEVPSRYDGVVEELFVEEGDVVPVGDVIISFRVGEEEGTDEESSADEGTEAASDDEPEPVSDGETEPAVTAGRAFAPPSARRLARELGVAIGAVDGSGPGGRVTEADVRAHAEEGLGADDGDVVVGDPDDAPTPRSPGGADERKTAVTKRGGTETAGTAQAAPEPAGRETTLATPATRKVARELGVDVDDVPTEETRDGEAFVTEADVRAYADELELEGADGAETSDESARPSPRAVDLDATDSATAPADGAANETGGASGGSADPVDTAGSVESAETIPYRGVRRTIGKQMERSKYTAPHVSHHDTVAVDRLVEARERLKPVAEERGVKLTYMPFVMKAIVAGLREYPVLNSELREDDEEIVLKDEYNLGVAVATDAGLMVPVVEDVDEKGLFELAGEISDLAARARDRTLKPGEMKGGTFSITNFGAIGGEYATPIINYPETAILGLGAIEKRPVVRERDGDGTGDRGGVGGAGVAGGDAVGRGDGSEVVAAPTLPLSLSIDHRVVDGAVAAEFVNTVMEHLEEPLLLLNEQW